MFATAVSLGLIFFPGSWACQILNSLLQFMTMFMSSLTLLLVQERNCDGVVVPICTLKVGRNHFLVIGSEKTRLVFNLFPASSKAKQKQNKQNVKLLLFCMQRSSPEALTPHSARMTELCEDLRQLLQGKILIYSPSILV